MRYGPEHKAQTRERILRSAAKLIRRQGFRAKVEEVMADAGLTVGGFYGHFRSKDDLLGSGLRKALRERRQVWGGVLEGLRGEAWFQAYADGYLSEGHRDDLAHGCPLPSSLSDLARDRGRPQKVLVEELESLMGRMAEKVGGPAAEARGQALAAFSMCVGAFVLARATRGHPLSNELLRAARERVTAVLR